MTLARETAKSIALSRRTLSIVRQNIAISLLTKGVFLALGAAGLAGLWLAVLADMGTSLLVTFNSMWLLAGRASLPAAAGAVQDVPAGDASGHGAQRAPHLDVNIPSPGA